MRREGEWEGVRREGGRTSLVVGQEERAANACTHAHPHAYPTIAHMHAHSRRTRNPHHRCAGVARTILCRLVVGLVGYAAVCIAFPFLPPKIW